VKRNIQWFVDFLAHIEAVQETIIGDGTCFYMSFIDQLNRFLKETNKEKYNSKEKLFIVLENSFKDEKKPYKQKVINQALNYAADDNDEGYEQYTGVTRGTTDDPLVMLERAKPNNIYAPVFIMQLLAWIFKVTIVAYTFDKNNRVLYIHTYGNSDGNEEGVSKPIKTMYMIFRSLNSGISNHYDSLRPLNESKIMIPNDMKTLEEVKKAFNAQREYIITIKYSNGVISIDVYD
jgi:hypothetical protein